MRARRGSVLPLCLLIGAAPAMAAAPGIPWSASRPLTWADFKGSVASKAPRENVAVTAAALAWSYEYEIEWSREGRCAYRVTAIESAAMFHPGGSWVRPGHTTAAVLAHEQGHFDITQIHKLLFDDASKKEIGVDRACEGSSARKVSAFVERDIARRVGSIYDDVLHRHSQSQQDYDAETRHGMDADDQQRWLDKIAAALRRRGWAE